MVVAARIQLAQGRDRRFCQVQVSKFCKSSEFFCKFRVFAATNLNLLSMHTSTDEYRVDENVLLHDIVVQVNAHDNAQA